MRLRSLGAEQILVVHALQGGLELGSDFLVEIAHVGRPGSYR
jgi:hypothetical protein